MWKRVVAFLIILFFVLLSDAVLSDWVPGYLQNVLGSPLKMGLMMALSSVVGFVMDLIFPQLLRESGVRKLAGGALVGALVFLFTMLSSTWWSYALIIALGMAAWGIYYELDSFMTQQFVAGVAPSHERSSVWGVVGVVRNAAYPLIDSVYTDLVARARKGRKHIMGMSSATFSLAYVVGPILSGFISGKLGEEMTFTVIGLVVCVVATILLVVTPKKLKLPQDEIQSWE